MPIRITGMNSGLDVESIISELVKAQETKVDSVKKKQTTLEWKQDAWKTLNSKIYKLFNGTLSNMRMETDYSKKTTDISNSAFASVITSDSAMNTTQKLKVEKTATAGYMTGAQIKAGTTKSSKLTDLGIEEGSTVSVTTGGKTTDITVTADMTIDGFVSKLKSAGLEASFDEKNGRLHIAAKESGIENDFVLTAANSKGTNALDKLGILSYDEAVMAEYKKYAAMTVDAGAGKDAVDADVEKRLQSYISQREELIKTQTTQSKKLAEMAAAYQTEYHDDIEDKLKPDSTYKTDLKTSIDTLKAKIEADGDAASEDNKKELTRLQGQMAAIENYESQKSALESTGNSISAIESNLNIVKDGSGTITDITASNTLIQTVKGEWDAKFEIARDKVAKFEAGTLGGSSEVHKVKGEDAVIYLNDVKYTGSSNTFEVNGLTITALAKSTEDVTLTTRQDTDGIYDMIKNFLTEYNTLINEMDKLYDAESTKGYEPLTDEEKESMTDSEVEKWETKIKNSILRRDSNLSTISSAMKNIMLQGATVNGEKMYLSNFGIETLGYFSSEENEKNAYHINGDADDATVSSKDNDLKAAIANDPDTVIAFFSQLSQNLYTELNSQSSSVEGVRSFGKFYDDKKMKDDYNTYTTKIKEQQAKLTAMQDRWYNKFSAMETALAKMQSNQSAVSSLLGG